MKYNKSILMTLGHNSSVIYFNGDTEPIGYEQERLSNIKSDSAYPLLAFDKVLSYLNYDEIHGANIFVSHWFDNFNLEECPEKYFNKEHFNELVERYDLKVITVSPSFTHHDAHAWSTKAFSENFHRGELDSMHHIVVDGFGNNQEVVSVYIDDKTRCMEPIMKVFGYQNSLGLLYQYATSFCGMKENQDEYKFLGYETMITELLTHDQIEDLRILAYNQSMNFMKEFAESNVKPVATGQLIAYNGLQLTKEIVHGHLLEILDQFRENDILENETEKRVIIGFYVQAVLEQTLLKIIKKFNIKNVALSGGCFMNVKLNKVILDAIPGKICVNPLAGDQGAAIGLYRKYTNSYFNYGDLCFGKRDKFTVHESTRAELIKENIFICSNQSDFLSMVVNNIETDMIVNIMQGSMEFGPRALCNTTTLANPSKENVKYINMVNQRNEVMPMAPVMLASQANRLLHQRDLDRVIGSNKFMIITHDFRSDIENYRGVLHNTVDKHGYTCRPQIIDDFNSNNISCILQIATSKCLINTSFNTHGRPILYSVESAIQDFRKQRKLDKDNRLMLVILNDSCQ